MRAAVTGGSGFIGSHLVDGLLEAGHTVVVLDTRPPHRPDVEFHALDITDQPALVRSLRAVDTVFHLAAVSNVNDAADHPVCTVDLNVTSTARVWEAARRAEVRRAVLASTVWVYGAAPGTGPADESTPLDPARTGHIYTASKIAAEMIAHNYAALYGQEFTILRYGIPFGPRMRAELVIPRFVRAAVAGETIVVHGDGTQHRNYLYIDDLIEGHLKAIDVVGANEVFNLEGPERITIRRIVETIGTVLGRGVAVEFGAPRPGDYAGRDVSNEKAARLLGWSPRVAFGDGMRRYVEDVIAGDEVEGDLAG
jgi:UDP-glucose 4-epimerase